MLHRKFYTIASIVAALILVLWFYIGFNSEYTMNRSLDAFVRGDYPKAKSLLESSYGTMPADKYYLHLAYVQRGLKNLPASDEALNLALKSAVGNNRNKDILFEIYLNQTLNAYLENDTQKFNETLKSASEISPGDEWVVFLNGVQNYSNQNYQKALINWETLPWSSIHSIWMQTAFKQAFDSNWISSRIMRSEIETGDYLSSRQSLEQDYQRTNNPEEKANIDFLLGLTYVKEGALKSVAAAVPYDKLSISYFNKVPVNKSPYNVEIQSVVNKFKDQAISLIDAKVYTDIPFYINSLANWGAVDALREIKERLFSALDQSAEARDWKSVNNLAAIIKSSYNDDANNEALLVFFNKFLESSAQNGDPTSMIQFLEAGKVLSASSKEIPSSIRLSVVEDILNYIPIDSNQLNLTGPYIEFSSKLNDPQLNNELIGLAGTIWQMPEMESKAISILELIAKDKNLSPETLAQLKSTLGFMYGFALNEDKPDKLLKLFALNEALKLPIENLNSPEEFAKRIEYIETLKKDNPSRAFKEALVLSKLDPQDVHVTLLVGMLAYEMGDYSKAYKMLSRLHDTQPEVKEAIIISGLLANGENSEKLAEIQPSDLSNDGMFHLGIGYLLKGDYNNSKEWLNRIEPKDDEVWAGLVSAAYFDSNWSEVLSYYSKLSPKFQKIESLQAMEIRALQKIGHDDVAQSKLLALLQAPENNDETLDLQLTLPFTAFKSMVLDDIDRNFIAGIYYLGKQDYDLSLNHFIKDTTPTAENYTNEAEIYIVKKRYRDARDALIKADSISKGSLNKVVLPLMGQLFYLQGRFADAWRAFSKYYDSVPTALENRLMFARTLLKIGRGDLAFAEVDAVESKQGATPESQLLRIDSLIRKNEFDVANQLATLAMKNENFELSKQIELAKLMVLTGYSNLIQQVIQKAEKANSLTLDDRIHLLQLYTAMGSFSQAEKLADENISHFSQSADGLLALAYLYEALSQPIKAMEFLQKAVQLEPENYAVRMKFTRYAKDPESLGNALEFYQSDLKAEPESISAKIAIARTWIDLAFGKMALHADKSAQSKDLPAELFQANNLIGNLIGQYTELPILYQMQGESLALIGKNDLAMQSLQKATSFNPADYESNRYAAIIEEERGNLIEAENYLLKALRFSPNNPELWRQAARISTKRHLPLETLYALSQLIKYRPNDFEAYFHLGNVNLLLKNPEGAIAAFERVLKISPDNTDAMKAILISLYDPTLRSSAISNRDLKEKRESMILLLKEKDPEGSAEIFKKLNIE